MKLTHYIYSVFLVIAVTLTSCHDIPEYENDPQGNFEALWTIINEHYCFLNEKNIDWDEIHARYGEKISPVMSREELFTVCAAMLAELHDGHTNLSSPWETSYYRKWWSDYPQNYDARLIEEHYFNFNYRQVTGVKYGILPQGNIGYMGYGSFATPIGEGNLDAILSYLATCDGLVIDIRDNGGGNMDMVDRIVGRFTTQRITAGYMIHKTGPGRNEFSEPYEYFISPAEQGRMMWTKPVVVLTNRSTFSAANNFVSVMQYLPQVTIVGARTGGGSGMPFSSELPCGWSVRFSSCSVLDARGNTTEFGIEPTPGCAIDLDPIEALAGRDTMLDFAINLLTH
ncbi:MAG: S41 family peptidase [Muribaculaceae bacterium]|nr:S41 family peptidase [Muribaculaceae bacterium]